MRVLILGGTGRTGKLLIQQALEKGIEVNVLVRDSASLENPEKLTIFTGSPLDKNLLADAMDGCQAILSTLNISRTSDFPWAPLRSPAHLLSEVAQNLISLAGQKGIQRFIICSAWGTRETKRDIPFWFRWLVEYSNIGVAYRDHEVQEQLWEQSPLDWTVIRPAGLTDKNAVQPLQISEHNSPRPHLTVSRLSVAHYMVSVLEESSTFRRFPVISAK